MRDVVTAAFESAFGPTPTYLTHAPGRVNLIGEHTDYNDGFVLPMAIGRGVWVAAHPRTDDQFRVHSVDYSDTISFSRDQLQDSTLPHWTSHVRGVWYLLAQQGMTLPTADIAIAGNVPIGAGLSSSAAIEISMIELGLALANQHMTQAQKALLGVEVEHKFMGMPSGVMDQMTSAASSEGHAILIDCRTLTTRPIHIPDGVSVIVIDTAKRRQLVGSAYVDRRRQCEEAAQIIGVSHLRDATIEQVEAYKNQLEDVRYRRARHIVTENARTLEAADALQKGDAVATGKLMNASHYSMRDDFEISWAEADLITEMARNTPGCFGARMTGGGFGGCCVALVSANAVEGFTEKITPLYQAETHLTPVIYAFQPAAGSRVIFKP
ncbi:MAG: galactokinase [Chloroflexi bacterium]|nr:galactokinase [Chloroflexota bacterium]